MMKRSFPLAGVVLAVLAAGCAPRTNYEQLPDGVTVTPTGGAAKAVRLQLMSERIVRVTAAPEPMTELPKSVMVITVPQASDFTVEEKSRLSP